MPKCSSSSPMKVPAGRPRRILTKNSGVAALEEIVGLGTSNSNVENVAGTPKLVDDSKVSAVDVDDGNAGIENKEPGSPGPVKQFKTGKKSKQQGASAAAEPEVKASRARNVKALMVQPSEDAQSSTGAVGSLEKASGSKRKKANKAGASKLPANTTKQQANSRKTKKPKLSDQTCEEDCIQGPKSGCPIQSRRRVAGHLSCVEIHDMLKKMGISNPEKTSKCVKRAIMFGHIKITGIKEDLNQIILEGDGGECGHTLKATLGDLLNQPDYAGLDYEDGLQEATVICKEEGCDEGRSYVTNICTGNPSWDCGKFHNHCGQCPGYGICINDYRNAHCFRCGTHPFVGLMGNLGCDTCERRFGDGGGDEDDDACSLM